MNEFLTKEDLSKILKVSRATIDRWRKEWMPSIKIARSVRFDKQEVVRWVKEHKSE